jgi:hypothetical protein
MSACKIQSKDESISPSQRPHVNPIWALILELRLTSKKSFQMEEKGTTE